MLRLVLLLELVGAEALVTRGALGQRVDELINVARGGPHGLREDDRRVDADDVLALLDHRSPPLAPDVLLELDPERAIVPRRSRAAIDFTRREDEAPALGQADDGVNTVGWHGKGFLQVRRRLAVGGYGQVNAS